MEISLPLSATETRKEKSDVVVFSLPHKKE